MLIAILICLLSDSTAVEQYRFERLQGQCSAWCYERNGTWVRTGEGTSTDKVEVYQCSTDDQDCHDCNIGCQYEFHNLRECYSRCNERAPCKAACKYHQEISRQTIDFDELDRNLSRVYPHDVYEDASSRTNSSIRLQWANAKQFSNPRAVVFMLFLLNYTLLDDPNEDPQGLYIGATPYYSFVAQPLAQNYCYSVHVLVVSKDGVVGKGVSSNKFITEAVVHVDNITNTSADIWFQTRPCAGQVNYTVQLLYGTDIEPNKFFLELESPYIENNIYRIHALDLIPDQAYRVYVLRKKKGGELFSYHGDFKTLPSLPGTNVTIKPIAGISATNITYTFRITDEEKLYGHKISNYAMKIESEDGKLIRLITIETDKERSSRVVTGLTPYTVYCVSMAVANPVGLGPYSKQHCNRTLSAPAGPPTLLNISVTTDGAVIQVTRPSPPKGELVRYYISFIHHNLVDRYVNLTEGAEQNVTLDGLESHTPYNINVAAVNSKGQRGAAASLPITTLQTVPEAAPQISTCDIESANATHISARVSWTSVEDDEVNGELQSYFLNLLQQNFVDGEGQEVNNQTHVFTLLNGTKEVFEVNYENITLDYSEHETVEARLAISTSLGVGPWSKRFDCKIAEPAKMGVDVVQIIVIVICIIALFVLIMGAFFYFFRFKTYKKTPYEEIKKLIRPETFSPCQHCMHNKEPKRWDVFICHVSEDTDYIVQLKQAFVREKIDVFFAKDELSWGCELHRVINDGLRDSKYGLVVLSKQFVNKCSKWTSSELSSLHSKSRLSSQDCILPIWKKDITEVEVGAFDMTLVGIKALVEEEMTVDQMAVELKKKLRNDGCWGCSMRKHNNQTSGGSTPKSEDVPLLGEVPHTAPSDDEGTNV